MLLVPVLCFCASLTAAQHHSQGNDEDLARVYGPIRIVRSANVVPAKNESKAATKCKEYSMLIWLDDYVSETPAKRKICDQVHYTTIIGGQNAGKMEFPHMARLGYGYPTKWMCAGSLISEKYILSAAHCGEKPGSGPPKKVLLTHYPDDAGTKEYDVARILLHPDYKPPSLYNDIMLVELTNNVEFSLYARPICLPDPSTAVLPKTGYVSGWNRTLGTTVSDMNAKMLKYSIRFVNGDECANTYKRPVEDSILKNGIDNMTQLCTRGNHDRDACEFLSGGPLQIVKSDCIWTQVGVFSSGFQCKSGAPRVHTRISAYVDWIENIVWP